LYWVEQSSRKQEHSSRGCGGGGEHDLHRDVRGRFWLRDGETRTTPMVRRPRRCGADSEDGRRPRARMVGDPCEAAQTSRMVSDALHTVDLEGALACSIGGWRRRLGACRLVWWAAPWPTRVVVVPLACGAASSRACRRPCVVAYRLVGQVRGGLQSWSVRGVRGGRSWGTFFFSLSME
jgi:hypothetical protein